MANFPQKLLDDQVTIGGKALTMTHIDSWEVGAQNWTPGFREEFQKRFGYDCLPYLPVMTGRAAESREVTERFLWDVRGGSWATFCLRTMLITCGKSAISTADLSIEAYGGGPLPDDGLRRPCRRAHE